MGRRPIFNGSQNERIEDLLYAGKTPKQIFETFVSEGYSATFRTLQNRIYDARVRLRAQIIREVREQFPGWTDAMCIYYGCAELVTKEDLTDPEVMKWASTSIEDEGPKTYPEPVPE